MKKSFVFYTTWRSFFELLEDAELIKELIFAIFDLVEGKDVVITNNKVRTAFNAIEPIMRDDLEAYESKCAKNKKAAKTRWSKATGKHSHADALQSDGDNANDNANENENENGNENVNGNVMSDLPGANAPSIKDVIEAAHNRGIEMTETEAQNFITYYFVELKGVIDGEPIHNWKNLLKSWDEHIPVDVDTLLGKGFDGYEVFLTLPKEIQRLVENEQIRFRGRSITKATAMAIKEYMNNANNTPTISR